MTTDWFQANSAIIQAISTVILVIITGIYAWRTHVISKATREQADASVKMVNEMVNAEFNSAAPVIQLQAADSVTADKRTVRIYWKNVGKGPALNFRCWIDDPENRQLRRVDKGIIRTAVAVETSVGQGVFSDFKEIDTEIDNYRLQLTQTCIRAQYESVFGKTYESSLHFPGNAAPELKYEEATEIITLDSGGNSI